jgi:hypothetical protein
VALTFSTTVNMPQGMPRMEAMASMARVALTFSTTVNMPQGMLRINDHR